MFGKFMNNYYYGKSGKGDYQKDDLPRTRWQLFWEMLRVRFAGLFRLNIVSVIAWLPAMYVLIQLMSNLFNIAGVAQTVEMDPSAATPEQLELVQNLRPLYNSVIMRSLLLLVPAIAITGPFQAGMAYVTRNWARDEHAFVWSDFKDALIGNWKQSLVISFITGLVPLIVYVGYQFYGDMGQQNMLFVVPQMLTAMLGLVWTLALVYFYPMMVTYKLNLRTLLRNAFLLSIGRLPQTAGARLVMLVPALLALAVSWFIPAYTIYALMVLAGYYLLIGNALARFVYASLSNAVFDKFINTRLEGVQINRGLAKEEDIDEGADDDEDTEA
ncbi:MAG: YesL family protein [Clostridiales bacterium]|nr:DUF624 domain-containing protein [Clostridia bacterium]NLD01898.1 YesL family protein [Clostridiales bacterium]